MFDTVRNHQRILLGFVLLLIFPAFVFFGLSGYDRMMGPGNDVATVAGEKISRQSLDAAHRAQMENMRQMLGGQLDVRMFDTPQARAQTLEQLITQQALLAEARRRGVTVADAEVQKAILAIPGLVGADGKFDFERYKTLLAQENVSPAAFEAQKKQELALQTLGNAIQSSVIVPTAVTDRLYALQEERRSMRVLTIDPKDFEKGIVPTDAQIEAAFKANAARFEVPEQVDVEYLMLDRNALEAEVAVSEDALRQYYEQNKGRFVEPPQRRASHILVKAEGDAAAKEAARAKATALLEKVKASPDAFADVAKASSEDPGSASQGGDLGYFARDMMVAPFADAAFSMKEGETSGLVESEFGFHIIRVTGVKEGGSKPFAEVRPEIEKAFRAQEAARKFSELAAAFTNTVYEQSDSLDPAAKKFGLGTVTVDGFTRTQAPGADKPDPKAAPLRNERVVDALFGEEALKKGRNTEAIEVEPGRLVSARVKAHRPAHAETLDAVRDRVKALVVADEARRLAREKGESLLARYRAGELSSLEGFAPPVTATRSGRSGVDGGLLAEAFRLPTDKLPSFAGHADPAGSYRIARLERVEGPDESAAQRKSLYRQQAERAHAQAAASAYVAAVLARTKITREPLAQAQAQ
ncbi:MAG: SurA N-terminal domain-containing protein [Lautropia sp.]